MEGPNGHECECDQRDADNQQFPVGMPTGERKPEYPGDDHGDQLHEHTGVGGREEEIDDEVHDTISNTSS